ncbi:MAG TPA: acetylornithine transaminase, partial [Burkholderiaceae bacterium]|nr:acetylornithine transaminase [Burkholderiaceae bacterium]
GPIGLLLNAPRPDLLRFMPALNVTTKEIDQMLAMLAQILDKLE